MKKVTRSIFDRLLKEQPGERSAAGKQSIRFGLLSIVVVTLALFIVIPTAFLAGGTPQKAGVGAGGGKGLGPKYTPTWSRAVGFAKTPALRDMKPRALTPEELERARAKQENQVKNTANTKPIRPAIDGKQTAAFIDRVINNYKNVGINAVTPPIQNFDGVDADTGSALFGGSRFAPPDTNAAVGPNHVVISTNMGVRVYNKTGTPLTPAFLLSDILVGVANAADNDGDPIVLYDQLADRWLISQFNLRTTTNSTHQHIAISQTSDPTGAYYAYDFLATPNRPHDYPHFGVWPDGYYMSTNDFSLPVFSNPFQGAGLYAFERDKMLVGDPTALVIGFNTDNTHGGMLPSNLQGFTPPPIGTPNLFFEFDAAIFGAPFDLIRAFAFDVDFDVPLNSTLTQGPNIAIAAHDVRNPAGRADIAQPPSGEGLDSIADRLMHALNFRVLAGGVQSMVLNWTVNVSGVNPTSAATYQAGIRWMELRRDAGTGTVTINQEATYAPGSGSGTGRDLWMAAVAQDGEGNIGLAANASGTSPALNPTAIYTGRLPGDPVNTLPQGEVDAMSAVTRGVQTATSNRWGDYSSLFIDPSDECTFWASFEYVDSPTATFDWNTRIFSFMVNPTCVTAPRGTINGTITNCGTGNPIPNAIITTPEGFFRQSDASGNFSMILTPGTYTVSVTAPGGFGTCTQMVTVSAGGTVTVNCCLAPSAIIAAAGATITAEGCDPANGAIDPAETVTVDLCVQNTGGADTVSLVGTLQATGGVTSPSGPQNYGVVVAGGATVCRPFTFTASGVCGGTITATLDLADGGTPLGTVTYTFTLGTNAIALTENFDGVTAPALPAGWVNTRTAGAANCTPTGTCALGANWVTSTATSDTAPNAAFHDNPSCVTDNTLDTPSMAITSPTAQVTFRNSFNVETNFDGGVLEVSSPNINGGTFTDITNVAVGGSFVVGGYNGTINTGATNFLNPLRGRMAWTGDSGGFITTTANLGPNVVGQTIVLRFRLGTDCSVGDVGWTIDTISVSNGFACCVTAGACTAITCPANVTVSNDPNQCGAVVNYAAPTPVGDCGTITCAPPSGSFFPVGTTTVTCTSTAGPTCSFTVTVNDTQPPTITCPTNIVAVAAPACPAPVGTVTTFPAPTASDNCPGVTVVCVPASGTVFPVGTTTVTCTATDATGNTATCSFSIRVFNVCVQDRSNPAAVLAWNTTTGEYVFCCNGTTFTGVGKAKTTGCTYTLDHTPADRRVTGKVDFSTFRGEGSLQSPTGVSRCTISDNDVRNNDCSCLGGGGGGASGPTK